MGVCWDSRKRKINMRLILVPQCDNHNEVGDRVKEDRGRWGKQKKKISDAPMQD